MQAREYGSSAFMLALAVVVWIGAGTIPVSPLEGQVGAAGFPKLLAAALGILAIARMVQIFLRTRRAGPGTAPAEARAVNWGLHVRAIGILAIGIGYVLLVPYLGYLLSIGLLLAAVAIYAGRRPSIGLGVVSVVGAVVLYVVFVRLLDVAMPAGFWEHLGLGLG
jgi:hypothetical protein